MGLTENDLLDLLADEISFPIIDEKRDVTRNMLSDRAHVSYEAATAKLERGVSEGKLIRFRARTKGGLVTFAYRLREE